MPTTHGTWHHAALAAVAAAFGVRGHPVMLVKGTSTQAEMGDMAGADPAVRSTILWAGTAASQNTAPTTGITADGVTCQPTPRLVGAATSAIRGM